MSAFVSPVRPSLKWRNDLFCFSVNSSRDILRDYNGDKNDIKLLFLNCDDLLNVLSSVASQTPNKDCILTIHMNSSLFCLARNLIIIQVISSSDFDPKNDEDLSFLWDVWYNSSWPKTTVDRFVVEVKKLLNLGLTRENLNLNEKNTQQLKELLHKWISSLQTGNLKCLSQTLNVFMYGAKSSEAVGPLLNQTLNPNDGSIEELSWEDMVEIFSSQMEMTMGIDYFPPSLKAKIYKDLRLYWNPTSCGNCFPSRSTRKQVHSYNPTQLNLDTLARCLVGYACPYKGYMPLRLDQLEPNPTEGILTRYCQTILKELVASYRKKMKNVSFHFYADDDLQMCRQETYDAIDCSILGDDVGLTNVMAVCKQKLKNHPDAILVTETLRWGYYKSTVLDYLESSLSTSLSMIPTLYGLHLTNPMALGSTTLFKVKMGSDLQSKPVTLFWRSVPQFENIQLQISDEIKLFVNALKEKCLLKGENGFQTAINAQRMKGDGGILRDTLMTSQLVLKRLTSLMDPQESLSFTVSRHFAGSLHSLKSWMNGRPLKRIISSQSCLPYVHKLFLLQNPPLRLVLIPTRHFVVHTCHFHPDRTSQQELRIDWADKYLDVHYVDNFEFHNEIVDGNLRILVSFLIPHDQKIVNNYYCGALVDLTTNTTMLGVGTFAEDKTPGISVASNSVFKWPSHSSEDVPNGPYMKAVSCKESRNQFRVNVKLFSSDNAKGLTVATNRVDPCQSAHQITLSLQEPEGIKPLVLNFSFPVMDDDIQATLYREKGTIQLVLPKGLAEPWPYQFIVKSDSRWEVDNLRPWNPKIELILHENPITSPLFSMQNCVNNVFKHVQSEKSKTFIVKTTNEEELWRIIVRHPVLESPDGTPMLSISALDLRLAANSKNQVLSDTFQSVFDQNKVSSVIIRLHSLESADLFRYLLRLNSLKVVPSRWQKEYLPLGEDSPYLASYITPLYLDKYQLGGCQFALCGKRSDEDLKLKRCSKCKRVFYCSVICQKRDWPAHKLSCT